MKEIISLPVGIVCLIILVFVFASCSHPLEEPCLNKTSPDFHGSSSLNCAGCHDLNIECNGCHFGSSGSKTPSDWIHGTTPHAQLGSSGPVCNTCHDLNRSYGNGPGICHDCHGPSGIHVTGEPWFNNSSPDFHGNSTLNCADCHDLNIECNECHFGATGNKSPGDWVHGTNPNDGLFVSSSVCNSCHELSRGFGNGPGVCHDCHGPSDSHVRGEAWFNNTNPDFHGNSSLNCADCHDLGTECSECHFDSSGSKSPSEWIHGEEPHDNLASSEVICNSCHGLSRGLGNGPGVCHDCHGPSESHVRGDAWFNNSSPDFHGNSSLNCADCHDPGTECSECHFDSSGSKSPSEWIHGEEPHDNLASSEAICNSCHGLSRGLGNGPGVCHDCHGPSESHVRGDAWFNNSSPDFHGNSSLNCADCHDPGTECSECHFDSSGSKSPSEWIHGEEPHDDLASSEPICNTCHELSRSFGNGPGACHDCHELENSHGVPFSDHAVQAESDPASCQECHGPSFNGGSGPACSECHTAGSPLTALNCTSCHGKPPTGGSSPNTDGAHSVHNVLTGITGSCGTCHQGAGTQTVRHYDSVVDVAFSGYNANSGTASYDAGSDTCSKVSCHGGNNTPDWFSGSLNVNTACSACHSSGGEYNSYVSGEHRKHVQGEGHPCTECHDTNKLQAVHFNDLHTPQMSQAGQTIRDELNYNGQYCLFTCHFGNEDKRHDEEKDW